MNLGPLSLDFMQNAYLVGTVVSIVAASVGFFVVLRGLSFAADAMAHVGFSGAAGAILLGIDPLLGLILFSLAAAAVMGALGERIRGRDVAIGIVLAFSLGLGALFLTLYTRYANEAFAILFGTIVGVSRRELLITTALTAFILVILLAIFRPLLFASVDPEVAQARGVPVRMLSIVFLMVLGVTISVSVQVVGVLLIFTLVLAPAATAEYLSDRPHVAILIAIAIALGITWAGITLAYYLTGPVSFYISALACTLYLVVRIAWPRFGRRVGRRSQAAADEAVTATAGGTAGLPEATGTEAERSAG